MHTIVFYLLPIRRESKFIIKKISSIFYNIMSIFDRAHAVKVVSNLGNFFDHLTRGYYKAFAILMKEWIDCGDIDNVIIQTMFERFTLKLELTTEEDALKALELLVISARYSFIIFFL